MTIQEITLNTGERALSVDTEEEFGRAMDSDLPIVAPDDVAAAFGFPPQEEAITSADYAGANADLLPDAD